ncbi:MAG: flagellar basal body rod protein FlgC [bacterium]
MSLFNIFGVAGSAMSAQNTRLNVTASNMANADSVAGSEKEAYKARQPVFSAMLNGINQKPESAGVDMLGIVESHAENAMRYEPNHPMANEDGYIFASNVNTIEEMTNLISASRSYQNNVEVINTSKQLLLQTLKLGE